MSAQALSQFLPRAWSQQLTRFTSRAEALLSNPFYRWPIVVIPTAAALLYTMWKGSNDEATTRKVHTILKTSSVSLGVLRFGEGLYHCAISAKTLWFLGRNSSHLPKKRELIPILETAVLSFSSAASAFGEAFFLKHLSSHLQKWSVAVVLLGNSFRDRRLDRALIACDQGQFLTVGTAVSGRGCIFEELVDGFNEYLHNNEEDIAGAARLFPSLFKPPYLREVIENYPRTAKKIVDYLKETYKAPISDQEIDDLIDPELSSNTPDQLKAMHEALSRIKQLNATIAKLPVLELTAEDLKNPRWKTLQETIRATQSMGHRVKKKEPQFNEFRKALLKDYDSGSPTVEVLNEIGLSLGDYKMVGRGINISGHVKMRVLDELADRGIYGRQDLIREGLICEEKNCADETVWRLSLFLQGQPLPPLPQEIGTSELLRKKTQRAAFAIFKIGKILIENGLRFYFFPYAATTGTLLGLIQPSLKLQKCSYFVHKALALVTPMTSTTLLGRMTALTAGMDLGEVIKDHLT